MTQILQARRNFRQIVVGQIQTGQTGHGGNLGGNALQAVARQIQICNLRQKSQTSRKALDLIVSQVEIV